MSRVRLLAVAVAFAVATIFLGADPSAAGEFSTKEKFKVGDKAPDFTLQDLAGREVRLSDLAGKQAVLLVFWALRCGSCRAEIPHLERLHRTYGEKGLAVLAVDTDGVDAATAVEVMKEIGIEVSYTVLIDPNFTVSDAYTNSVVPLTIVIDRQGVIRYIHTGFEEGAEKEYEAAVLQALGS